MEWYQEIAKYDLNHIKIDMHIKGDYDISFIYKLFNSEDMDKPIYIGQTKNITSRLKYHDDENVKDFNFYSVEVVDSYYCNDIEALEIVYSMPKFNFSLPKNDWFMSQFDLIKYAKENRISGNLKSKIENTRSIVIGSYRYWYKLDIFDLINRNIRKDLYEVTKDE